MAGCLLGVMPLPEPMLTQGQLNHQGQISIKNESTHEIIPREMYLTTPLQNAKLCSFCTRGNVLSVSLLKTIKIHKYDKMFAYSRNFFSGCTTLGRFQDNVLWYRQSHTLRVGGANLDSFSSANAAWLTPYDGGSQVGTEVAVYTVNTGQNKHLWLHLFLATLHSHLTPLLTQNELIKVLSVNKLLLHRR